MRIVSINTVNHGSTGKIMLGIGRVAIEKGNIFYPAFINSRGNRKKEVNNKVLIGTRIGHFLHSHIAYTTGIQGTGSKIDTAIFLCELTRMKPELIHLHNLHDNYINLPMLFSHIKKNNIPVVWTLHDCWSFTGQCPHFTMVKCDKWKTGCHDCQQIHVYPSAMVDRTRTMWQLKKKWFTGVENMIIVTPSQWLADLVKQSYLKDYPVKVIHNGIDLNIFKPSPSDFREKHGILPEQRLLLGVAFGWERRKGLDVFIELANRLPEKYKIVLVGTDETIDPQLPKVIISIHRTENPQRLAEIYTAADVFVNPTREENYPTVNMEAIACGTPVITFDTGGSPEILDETCGSVVAVDDIDALEAEIVRVSTKRPYSREACLKRARTFDMKKWFEEYVRLYEDLR